MSSYFITAVRYENNHSRITKLKVHQDIGGKPGTQSEVKTKMDVVTGIMLDSTYHTALLDRFGNWVVGAKVHYYKSSKDEYFLRTDQNQTEADNLGELPEF